MKQIKIRNSLSTIVLKSVLSIYILVTFITMVIQLFMEYKSIEKNIYQDLKAQVEVFQESLSESLWEFNDILLESTVKGIYKIPIIEGVKVSSLSGSLSKKIGVWKNQKGEYFLLLV